MRSLRHLPILMQPFLVDAVMKDKKTVTRRLPGLDLVNEDPQAWEYVRFYDGHGKFWSRYNALNEKYIKCPYGNPGDIIWIRETYYAFGHWTSITDTNLGTKTWTFVDLTLDKGLDYKFPNTIGEIKIEKGRKTLGWYKRPGIFMPKEACRNFLEIEDLECERLQDITEGDCISEGILTYSDTWLFSNFPEYAAEYAKWETTDGEVKPPLGPTPKQRFKKLWSLINGPDSWEKDPWLWVITFKKTDKPTDFIKP